MDLEAIEAIKRLKYRYFRSLDLKRWDDFGDCLAEDIRARYGTNAMGAPMHFDKRDDVVEAMAGNLSNGTITMHVAQHPDIDVDGDSASASWAFEDTVIVPEFEVILRGAGYYNDEYRREADGKWRISATSYERVYEAVTSLKDTPSFKLIANRWDPKLAH